MNLHLIQKELESSIERLVDRKKIVKRLTQVQGNLDELLRRQRSLDKEVSKEKGEYERLENAGLSSMFHKVLGNKEEKLEKERQEYLNAVLKYNECVKDIELLEYEKEILVRKRDASEGVAGKIDQLLVKKEKGILQSDHQLRPELVAIHGKNHLLLEYRKEIIEALKLGRELLNYFARIKHHLVQARDWGRNTHQRNRWSKNAQYSHVDKARDMLYQAKRHMQLFADQIDDVFAQHRLKFQVEFPNFNTFSDIFFNNLISDWIFQSKVQKTLGQVSIIHKQVLSYTAALENEDKKVQKELEDLAFAKRNILLTKK